MQMHQAPAFGGRCEMDSTSTDRDLLLIPSNAVRQVIQPVMMTKPSCSTFCRAGFSAPHVWTFGYSFYIRTLANPLPGRRHGAKSKSGGVICPTGWLVIFVSSPASKNIPLSLLLKSA